MREKGLNLKPDISRSKFTVLGSKGFIGSHLLAHLQKQGVEVLSPYRDDPSLFGEQLGHVIYCIGLTANFRERPFDTVRAHVLDLLNILENGQFDSFLYLSSTRLYLKGNRGDESADVRVNSEDPEDLYNLSKLMGESICFASDQANVRVVRLSNVFGKKEDSSDFLSSVISDALEKGRIFLKSGHDSKKDYVDVNDVVALLPKIAVSGEDRLYNIASGKNVSHRCLLDEIKNITGCEIQFSEAAKTTTFPLISIRRVQKEFGFFPKMLIPFLKNLIPEYALRLTHD